MCLETKFTEHIVINFWVMGLKKLFQNFCRFGQTIEEGKFFKERFYGERLIIGKMNLINLILIYLGEIKAVTKSKLEINR